MKDSFLMSDEPEKNSNGVGMCPFGRNRWSVQSSRRTWPLDGFSKPGRRLSLVLLCVLPWVVALSAQAKLHVVATTGDLGAIASQVGGDKVDVVTLASPVEDPHYVDAKPSFIVKLNRADALIEGGAELELGWLPALLERARNTKIAPGAPGYIKANQGIQLVEVPTTFDRSQGDIHALGNPHFLTDPGNAIAVAARIAESFCQIDPKSSATYRANQQRFAEQLTAKLVTWEKQLAPFQGQHIASYHDSWPYFGQRFGLKIDLFLEPKPGIPPTPSHLADVVTKMKEEKVRVIFLEPYLNRHTADAVARNTGAVVLPVSQFPGGVKGTDKGYIELMDVFINSLARILAGQTVSK